MNTAPNSLIQWLLDFQLAATFLLAAACLAGRWIRQPVQRVALGWAVSLALILLAVTAAVPAWPRWRAVRQMPPELTPIMVSSLVAGQPSAPPQLSSGGPNFGPSVTISHASPNSALSSPSKHIEIRYSSPFAILPWLGRLFALGVTLVGLWLLWGRMQTLWIYFRASAAPAWLQTQLEQVAERVPLPRLLLTNDVPNAVALGILCPTILLPAALAQQADANGLRAVLAHELAHIRHRDLWLIGLFRALLLVLFPHPLYWVMRRTVRASQEAVADAVAAGGRGHDYADGLIGWMRQVIAPRRKRLLAAPTVGIWEKPSELSTRITLLMDETFPVQTSVSRGWRVGAMAVVGAAALALSLFSVRPAAAGDSTPAPQPGGTAASDVNKVPTVSSLANTNTGGESFIGGVIDKFSRAPVAGAIVHVRCEISSSTEHRTVEETERVTDADGHFQFGLTPDLVTNRYTYLNFEITHSNYARMPWDGYALGMIRKNQALGARPFFEQLELTPGEGISGALVRPDGSPAAGVKILTYSKASKNDMAEYGSFAETRTDASGHFNVNVIKGGEAVLWLLPQDLAPATHLLHQQRGDLGQLTLENGIPITGQVLANDGSPVDSVWVNAELTGGPAKKRIGMPVADAMSRSALTDRQGRFSVGPLPAGDYDLLISENPRDSLAEDRSTHPLADVFLHQKLHLESGPAAAAVEIHAVPHVLVAIQQLDSQGKPHKTHAVQVSGQFQGMAWWGQGIPDETGKIAVKVPHGLTDAQITLMVNEHQSTRSRWSSDSPWSNEHRMTAPVLDHDYQDVSVVYYTSPILLVRAAAEDGSTISSFKCRLEYAKGRKPDVRPPNWIDGVTGDVDFEKQPDGHWRSEQLLPDENLQLTVEADGFKSYTRTVNLPEGTTREVNATLQKL